MKTVIISLLVGIFFLILGYKLGYRNGKVDTLIKVEQVLKKEIEENERLSRKHEIMI